MSEREEQGSFEFFWAEEAYPLNDPRSAHWSFDPNDPRYGDDPYRAQDDIALWVEYIQLREDIVLDKQLLEADSIDQKKSSTQLDKEDINAVIKAIKRPDVPQLGQLGFILAPMMDTQVAFGGQIRSGNVAKEKLIDLTEQELALTSPEFLRSRLLGQKYGPQVLDHVTFPARERKRLFKGPYELATKTWNQTFDAGQLRPTYDERLKAAGRSVMHAFENKARPLTALAADLERETKQLEGFKEVVGNFRFARIDQASMLILMAAARALSFDLMLEVAAIEQRPRWDGRQREAASKALDARLFHGPQHLKTWYWNQMLDLAIKYASARAATIKGNIAWARGVMQKEAFGIKPNDVIEELAS